MQWIVPGLVTVGCDCIFDLNLAGTGKNNIIVEHDTFSKSGIPRRRSSVSLTGSPVWALPGKSEALCGEICSDASFGSKKHPSTSRFISLKPLVSWPT